MDTEVQKVLDELTLNITSAAPAAPTKVRSFIPLFQEHCDDAGGVGRRAGPLLMRVMPAVAFFFAGGGARGGGAGDGRGRRGGPGGAGAGGAGAEAHEGALECIVINQSTCRVLRCVCAVESKRGAGKLG